MLDQQNILKLCSHLKEKAINPFHFDKMNVALSVGLLNNNVAAAILYHIDKKNIDPVHKTTAWFLSTIHKWFKLMTSRYEKLVLSHFNENTYTESITFLKEFIERLCSRNNGWRRKMKTVPKRIDTLYTDCSRYTE